MRIRLDEVHYALTHRYRGEYRREAISAFANPSKAKRKVDLADVFSAIKESLALMREHE
jgi:hypothetical protein